MHNTSNVQDVTHGFKCKGLSLTSLRKQNSEHGVLFVVDVYHVCVCGVEWSGDVSMLLTVHKVKLRV